MVKKVLVFLKNSRDINLSLKKGGKMENVDNKSVYKTIKYYKAKQLSNIQKSKDAEQVIIGASEEDNIGVLLTITNPLKIERAVNLTKGGFGKIRELVPI